MSKHIYLGGERILFKLCDAGSMPDPTKDTTACGKNYTAKYADLTGKVKTRFDSLGVSYFGKDNAGKEYYKAATGTNPVNLYYFHSDHLGSASLITDGTGHLNQHLAYIPYGEVFINQQLTSFDSRYKFTGKEMDAETGLYYSSQRYLDPKFPGFITSDELREKYPNIGSYVYCAGNPLKFIDPDGRLILGYKSGMSMRVSFQELGNGNLTPNYSLTNGSNHVRNIYSNNPANITVLKGRFEYDANLPDVITYGASVTDPLKNIKPDTKSGIDQVIADRNVNSVGAAVEWGCTAIAGFVNSSSKNNFLDIVNSDNAFGLAYNTVMKNGNLIADKFKNANWSVDFKSAIKQGRINIMNFKADIMNYMVDGNMNMDNFKLKGYSGDFNTYKNAVYQMGEQLLNSSGLNLNVPQQNTTTNNLKDTYIYMGR